MRLWAEKCPCAYSGQYSVRMWEIADQKNFAYGHFSLSSGCSILYSKLTLSHTVANTSHAFLKIIAQNLNIQDITIIFIQIKN